MQNERVDPSGYYLPYIEALLNAAHTQTLAFVIDGSEVGDGCITLMISLIYRKRAIPVTWLVVKGKKGHLPEETHLALLKQLQAVLPEHCSCILLGDGEFDGIGLLAALQDSRWQYVCRTAKNTQVFEGRWKAICLM